MLEFVASLQYWHWIAIGLVLMGLELLAPGAFMLWIGIAAVIVGSLAFVLDLSHVIQLVAFAILAPICAYIGSKFFSNLKDNQAARLLGRRGDSLIGQEFILEYSLSGGTSRMRVGDSFWTIKGPNLPAGTHVIVIAVDGNYLIVDRKPK